MIERRILTDGAVRWKARIKSGGEVVAWQTFRFKGDAETWGAGRRAHVSVHRAFAAHRPRQPRGAVRQTESAAH
jgi:hypothetical protein